MIISFIYVYTCIHVHICVDKYVMLINKVAEEYWEQKLGAVTACYQNNS